MGKGRPKGSLNKINQRVKEIWSEFAEELAENTAISAKSGDEVGLRIFWERFSPPRAGAPVEFDMPSVLCPDDLAPAYDASLQVTRILEAQAKVVGFQFGPPWRPDTKTIVERLTQMLEQDAETGETRQQEAV